MSADAQEQAALSFLSTSASRSHHATLCARAIAQQYDRFRGAVEVRSHCEALERAALRRAREQRRGLVEGALQRSRAQFEADLSALQWGRVENVSSGLRVSNEQLPAPVTFSPHPRDAGTGARSRVVAARPLEEGLGPKNRVTVHDGQTALTLRASMDAPSLSDEKKAQRLQADEDATNFAAIPVAGSPYVARLAGALATAEAERQRQRARKTEAARDEDEELALAIRLSKAEVGGTGYVFSDGVTSEHLLDSYVARRAVPSMPPSASAFALGLAPSGYVSSGALKGGGGTRRCEGRSQDERCWRTRCGSTDSSCSLAGVWPPCGGWGRKCRKCAGSGCDKREGSKRRRVGFGRPEQGAWGCGRRTEEKIIFDPSKIQNGSIDIKPIFTIP